MQTDRTKIVYQFHAMGEINLFKEYSEDEMTKDQAIEYFNTLARSGVYKHITLMRRVNVIKDGSLSECKYSTIRKWTEERDGVWRR
jgi:hypothetical protein